MGDSAENGGNGQEGLSVEKIIDGATSSAESSMAADIEAVLIAVRDLGRVQGEVDQFRETLQQREIRMGERFDHILNTQAGIREDLIRRLSDTERAISDRIVAVSSRIDKLEQTLQPIQTLYMRFCSVSLFGKGTIWFIGALLAMTVAITTIVERCGG